jgi:hypothetical protein
VESLIFSMRVWRPTDLRKRLAWKARAALIGYGDNLADAFGKLRDNGAALPPERPADL